MIELGRTIDVRCVVVALDASIHDLRVLEGAADLAEQLRVDLQALLVEDEDLLRLARLPFAREVNRTSGTERALNTDQLSRVLRARSDRFREAIERLATSGQIGAQLRVVRGHYLTEALSAAASTDVLFLGSGGARRMGRESGKHSPADTVAKPSGDLGACCVMYDGTEAAARALAMAHIFCEPDSLRLTVLIPADNSAAAAHLREEAEKVLAGTTPRPCRFVSVSTRDSGDTIRHLRRENCSLLLMPRDQGDTVAQHVTALLKGLDCPLVLVG